MVLVFSFLLFLGCIIGQVLDTALIKGLLSFITSVCLSFIMMEVGIEFSKESKSFRSYGGDLLFASVAALLPALLWIGYFVLVMKDQLKPAIVMGISSAPTSAGVLFVMLMAAGLGSTWVFKKARVLAVLDDLVTILILTPLEILIHGFRWSSFATILLIMAFIFLSFRFKNAIPWPVSQRWLIIYSLTLTVLVSMFKYKTNIHLEVLIPAFMMGCLLKPLKEDAQQMSFSLANLIRGMFMLLVGATFPKINMGSMTWTLALTHVVLLTILANVGKSFLVFCYTREATFNERMALSVAMFPRGEVGAAVLLIGLGYGFSGNISTLAFLSLSLNLLMTSIFIWIVIKLLKHSSKR